MMRSLLLLPFLFSPVTCLWFNEHSFHSAMDRALRRVTQLLDDEKSPEIAGSISHDYDDKYELVEFLAQTGASAMSNTFESLGLSSNDIETLIGWANKRRVTLKFFSEEKCTYSRQESHEEESTVKRVEKRKRKSNDENDEETLTKTIVTTVTDHYWKFNSAYNVLACRGVGSSSSEDCVELSRGSNAMELKSKSDTSPPRTLGLVTSSPVEVDITALLKTLIPQAGIDTDEGPVATTSFHIDRNSTHCKTPSRNSEVDAIMLQSRLLHTWVTTVTNTFFHKLLPFSSHNSKRGMLNADAVFSPIIPLFVDCSDVVVDEPIPSYPEGKSSLPSVCVSSGSVALSDSTKYTFLKEQIRTLVNVKQDVSKMFCCDNCSAGVGINGDGISEGEGEGGNDDVKACSDDVFTSHEAKLVVTLLHLRDLCERLHSSVLYVETLLQKQLSAAIGKEISPNDLSAYMAFHNQKLLKPTYRPQQMTFAVRRSKTHSPEGRISLEGQGGTPVYVMSRGTPFGGSHSDADTDTHRSPPRDDDSVGMNGNGDDNSSSGHGQIRSDVVTAGGADSVTMSIDSSTVVSLAGERYVHAHLQHVFADDASGGSGSSGVLHLTAQARQFSSFILLIGRVPSKSSFDPLFGVIVKNKDDLRIPLDVAVIPSAKEFKDAIGSLSPEQQQFAKAFRNLQMQSTLFGVCVIQIKPQLEKVLNLPPDSLTKEIELTENLMEMFIKYQIPPDMLSAEEGGIGAGAGAFDLSGEESGGGVEGRTGKTVNNLKVAALNEVKSNVAAIQDMIGRAKQREIKEKELRDAMLKTPPSRQPSIIPTGQPSSFPTNENTILASSSASFGAASAGHVPRSVSGSGPAEMRGGHSAMLRGQAPGQGQEQGQGQGTAMRSRSEEHAPDVSENDAAAASTAAADSSHSPTASPDTAHGSTGGGGGGLDVTALPALLARKFEEFGQGSVIRPAIITTGPKWEMSSQAQLLGGVKTRSLHSADQRTERLQAFELLDALTKSGGLQIKDTSLHVIISSAHIFDKSLIDTIIQDNIDPIAKLEQSTLVMASTLHGLPASELVELAQLPGVSAAEGTREHTDTDTRKSL